MRGVFILLLIAVHGHAGIADWLNPASAKAKRIQQVMEEFKPLIQKGLNDYQIPGVSIGIIAEGNLVYSKGFGFRDREQRLPATADTVYSIGSCTKGFTSFLIGAFVDQGVVNWDQRVIDIYPQFRLSDPQATLNVTFRDLLTHRSGMPRHGYMYYNAQNMSRSDVMNRLRYLESSCGIRERYQYNDLMYVAAGFSMEYLTGQSWESLVSEWILEPLGMTHTSFDVDKMQKESNFAVPYLEKNETLKRMLFRNVSLIGPAGGINSNVVDLAKWVQMHLNGGVFNQRPLISPAALQEMHTPQTIVSGAPESNESLICATGLGWNVMSYRGHYYVSHDGGLDGFTSLVGFLPRDDIGIVILCNRNLSTFPRYLSFQMLDRLLDLPYINWLQDGVDGIQKTKKSIEDARNKEDLTRKKGTQPSHGLQEFTGDYTNDGYGTLSIAEREAKLCLTLNGLDCMLDHWHYDVFVISEEAQEMLLSREGTKISFQNGLNGEVEKISIPFEPKAGDIVFMKKPAESLTNTAYLKQFVGVYEIYGYVVEIVLQRGVLCALISGQPLYELVSASKNEFTVKSLSGYTVRFVMSPTQKVDEVLLVQPYGAFSAKPRK